MAVFNRRNAFRIFSIIVGAGLLFYLFSSTDGQFVDYIKSLRVETLAKLFAVYLVILLLDILRLLMILHPNKKSMNPLSFRGIILAPSLNMLFPGRAGDINALVASKSSDWPLAQRTRNLVLLRLTDLVILSCFAALLATSIVNIEMSISIIIISLFAFLFTYKMLPHFIEKFATIVNLPIGEFKPEEDKIAINRFVITGFSSTIFWTIQGLFTYLIILSFGVDSMSALAVISALSVANLSKIIPITPGGVGIYENALSLALVQLGDLSIETAGSIALVDGIFRYILTASIPWLGLAINSTNSEV
jgi:hypothetical protein